MNVEMQGNVARPDYMSICPPLQGWSEKLKLFRTPSVAFDKLSRVALILRDEDDIVKDRYIRNEHENYYLKKL